MTLELIAERDIWKERAEKAEGELQRYKQVESEGRLIILPCKVGTRIYIILSSYDAKRVYCTTCAKGAYSDSDCEYYKANIQEGERDCESDIVYSNFNGSHGIKSIKFELKYLSEFGKTVFLSRQEAEAALKAQTMGAPFDEIMTSTDDIMKGEDR